MFKIEVYVIFKDGEWYRPRGRKGVYFKGGSAKAVITIDGEYDAKSIYKKEEHWNKDYDDLPKSIKDEYIEKARSHYQIKIFTDSGQIYK